MSRRGVLFSRMPCRSSSSGHIICTTPHASSLSHAYDVVHAFRSILLHVRIAARK